MQMSFAGIAVEHLDSAPRQWNGYRERPLCLRAPAVLQRAGLAADVLGTGAQARGGRGRGGRSC